MRTLEPKIPDIDGKPSPNIYSTNILKQGYECTGAACSRDSIKNFSCNGHTIGHMWKFLEQDLNIKPLADFSEAENFEKFSDRVTGYMCATEGDLPPEEWHTEFKERLYTALKLSTNKDIKHPDIKGVDKTASKYLTKKEYWKLYLAEKQGVDASKEEAKRKEDLKKKEEKERKEREEKERREKEEKKKREEAEAKRKAEEAAKLADRKAHAALYGIEYDGRYWLVDYDTDKVPSGTSRLYKEELLDKCKSALSYIYNGSGYRPNDELIDVIKNKASIEYLLERPHLWGGAQHELNCWEFGTPVKKGEFHPSTTELFNSVCDVKDMLDEYNSLCGSKGEVNVVDDLLYHYCRVVMVSRTGEQFDTTYDEDKLFLPGGSARKYVDMENPIEGFKKFIKEYDFSKLNDDTDCAYEGTSYTLFMDNLDEIKKNLGVGGFMKISDETKKYVQDVAKEGMEQGAMRTATKKISRLLARKLAARSGKKGKALTALTDTLGALLEGPEGQALAALALARGLPILGSKFGKVEAAERIARKFDVQAVAIVSEQVTDVAVDLAEMGLGELLNVVKPLLEDSSVEVTPVGALSAGGTSKVEQIVAEKLGVAV